MDDAVNVDFHLGQSEQAPRAGNRRDFHDRDIDRQRINFCAAGAEGAALDELVVVALDELVVVALDELVVVALDALVVVAIVDHSARDHRL